MVGFAMGTIEWEGRGIDGFGWEFRWGKVKYSWEGQCGVL